MKPRFSILVATYNRKKLLAETIDSVLRQTFAAYELFVIDDGSTDGTVEMLHSYGSRIKVLQQRNQGPEVARNAAAALAEGEYLIPLDSDDLLFPSTLAIYDHVARAFDSPPLILGNMYRFEQDWSMPPEAETSGPVEVIAFRDYISKTISLPGSASMIVVKKTVLDEAGGMRNSTPQTWHCDDMNLLLKTGIYGPCVSIQRPYTVAYRLHGENSVRNLRQINDGLLQLARSERRGEYPGGRRRQWDRRATIGGRATSWAIRECWRTGHRRLALEVLLPLAPMIGPALWNRFARRFKQPPQTITLPETIPAATSEAPAKVL
jgi:glycosyltransferase involved in cell wall biosynthesis